MRLGLIGAQDRSSLTGVYSMSDKVENENFIGQIDNYLYRNKNFYYGSLSGANIYGFDISRDGYNLYLIDLTSGSTSIDHFKLSTEWDITTAYFVSRITNVATTVTGPGEGSPTGIRINDDGTILSFNGQGGDRVFNYYLPTPYSLTNALYGNIKTLQVIGSGSGQDTQAQAIAFGDNGTKMYIVGYTNDRIYQWDLSTAWDISTASYSNKSLSVTTQEGEPRGLYIGDNGTKVYVVGPVNDQVRQYNLSTPWDISTGSYVAGTSVLSQDSFQQGIYFKPDGTKMFMIGTTNDRVYEYSLSSAWDITTLSFTTSILVNSFDLVYLDIAFSSDGTRMYLAGDNDNTIDMYTLSTAWDITTYSFSTQLSVGASPLGLASLYGMDVSSDGSKLYILDGTYGVKQFDMLVPWELRSTNIGYYSISGQSTQSQGLAFGDNGTKMYVVDDLNDRVYQYNLTIPWVPTNYTTTFVNSFSILSQEGSSQGVVFSRGGNRMYIVGLGNDIIYQYNLSTPWDISTVSYSNKSLPVGGQDISPRDIATSDSTHKFYILGDVNDRIYQYDCLF